MQLTKELKRDLLTKTNKELDEITEYINGNIDDIKSDIIDNALCVGKACSTRLDVKITTPTNTGGNAFGKEMRGLMLDSERRTCDLKDFIPSIKHAPDAAMASNSVICDSIILNAATQVLEHIAKVRKTPTKDRKLTLSAMDLL